MSESGSAPVVENNRERLTRSPVSNRFKDYIEKEKPGLKRFYKWETQDEFNQYLSDPVTRGIAMIQKVKERGCPEEVAMSLSLLALYDLVVLIGASSYNSISMGFGEDGARATLENTLRLASEVYSDAGGGGITAVRFLNSRDVYFGVSPGQISSLMKRIVFEGVTNIGTRLRDKVLANHVTDNMKKPLLVIVLTDAEIEGEVNGLLRDVIVSQAVKLTKKHNEYGPQAVAYQFAKIGKNEAALDLVKGLDDDKLLGTYIDCMGRGGDRLEDLPKHKWRILPKLLLGAISRYWDTEAIPTTNDTLQNLDGELCPPPLEDSDLEDDGNSRLPEMRNESEGARE